MKTRALAWLFLLICGVAKAEQGCAPGFYPGGMQPGGPICVPSPGYGTTNNTADAGGGTVWANRWGAVALGEGDDGVSVAGVAEGLPSRGKAKRAAITDCESGGGHKCEIFVSYTNQCITLATGGGYTSGGTAASVQEADSVALSRCSANSSGTCRVLYQACSLPEKVR
ncbi:DUF4189 domain-containing protein [Lysobacter solisilvae (ex Woo and Kim 2020)]|uniref:DUF4189 domain-containing protein n=1 Tax=Agrilutibacter terrestris TaxID=2865112 RepID=A0A7H0FXV5_9GAMM|nr:DUF4189 domain-containing protein [Lysobacter terrestris]